jgi:hypothetical protein
MRITMTMGDRHGVAIMLKYGTDPTTTPGALIRRPNCQNLSPIPGASSGGDPVVTVSPLGNAKEIQTDPESCPLRALHGSH